MDSLIQISFYISIFAGGLLLILMLLSILGGLDLDLDVDSGGADVDSGGLGVIKSGLTFLTFSSWVANIMLSAAMNPWLTLVVSLAVGIVTVLILSYFIRLLLKLQSNVNWEFHQAAGKSGKVYLKIPKDGTGLIQVNINGVTRELKATSEDSNEIPTGAEVLILEVEEEIAAVTLYESK